jgi:simple sugar transport system ATP-binding protein
MINDKEIILKMRHINKSFPGVVALSDVNFTLRRGEIHALMGENGAGKSTLIKVLTGVEEFESGEIKIDKTPHPIINKSPQEVNKYFNKYTILILL